MRYVQSSMENAVGALYVRETFAGESKRMVSAFGPETEHSRKKFENEFKFK